MDPAYAASYRELARRHWWWRARNHVVLREVGRLLGRRTDARILDVGCGDGLLFPFLARYGEVEGVEPDEATLSPDNPWRHRIHVQEFDEWCARQGQYDLVLMLDVIEHLERPSSALCRVADLLAPGGRVLITVPAFNLLWTTHDELNRHHVRFTRASLSSAATRAGLKVIRARYLFQALFLAKLAQRAKELAMRSPPRVPGVPSPWLNDLLYGMCRAEQAVLSPWTPIGSSIIALAARAGVRGAHVYSGTDDAIDNRQTLP